MFSILKSRSSCCPDFFLFFQRLFIQEFPAVLQFIWWIIPQDLNLIKIKYNKNDISLKQSFKLHLDVHAEVRLCTAWTQGRDGAVLSNDTDSKTVGCEWLKISFNRCCGVLCFFQKSTAELHMMFPWTTRHIHTMRVVCTVTQWRAGGSCLAQRNCSSCC